MVISFSNFRSYLMSLSRHPHIVKLFGCSNDRSTMQFIFFHDDISRNAAEVNSLAAFLLEFSRSHDVFSLVDTMIDFVSTSMRLSKKFD